MQNVTKESVKHKVVVRAQFCKGCGLCIEYCPRKVLRYSNQLNSSGYYYAEPSEETECSGCMACVLVCPDCVIEVYDE